MGIRDGEPERKEWRMRNREWGIGVGRPSRGEWGPSLKRGEEVLYSGMKAHSTLLSTTYIIKSTK